MIHAFAYFSNRLHACSPIFKLTNLGLLANADLRYHRAFNIFHRHGNIAAAHQRQQQNVAFQIVDGVDAQSRNIQIEFQQLVVQIETL